MNINDFTLWNVKDFIFTVKTLVAVFSVWHSDFLPFVCCMHVSRLLECWSQLHPSSRALAYYFEGVLLSTYTAWFPKCQALPLTVGYTTVLTMVYLKLFIVLFGLLPIISQFSCHYVCDQSLCCFSFHLMLFLCPLHLNSLHTH